MRAKRQRRHTHRGRRAIRIHTGRARDPVNCDENRRYKASPLHIQRKVLPDTRVAGLIPATAKDSLSESPPPPGISDSAAFAHKLPMQLQIIDPSTVRDISSQLLDDRGELKPVPSAVLEQTTDVERSVFGARHACYLLPTAELVTHLRELIGARSALEIGSGNGVLAKALGIPASDSYQQDRPDIAAYYQALRQKTIRYGENVQKRDALEAVRTLRPQVVVGAWVTHRYDPRRHWAEGNMDGVDEEALLELCEQYIFIGNDSVHAKKSIWRHPHRKAYLPFIFSRAKDGSKDFIAVWDGLAKPGLPTKENDLTKRS